MRQIELVGCSRAGKSTLAREALQACRGQGIDVLMIDGLMLEPLGLAWVKCHLMRTLLLDVLSLWACVISWRTYREFSVFALRIILQLPVSHFEKLNLLRNVGKRIGAFELARRRHSDQQMTMVDGGTLQTAHHLFVHINGEASMEDLQTFTELVPLPDAVVYVRQRESVLVERLMKCGHRRLGRHTNENVELFVRRATQTFDQVIEKLVHQGRLAMSREPGNVFTLQGLDPEPLLTSTLARIGATIAEPRAGDQRWIAGG